MSQGHTSKLRRLGHINQLTMKKEPQQQEQELHPYMSLYEPLLVAPEPAEEVLIVPEETISSFAVADQVLSSTILPPPRIRINTTTNSINRAKKRQKVNCRQRREEEEQR